MNDFYMWSPRHLRTKEMAEAHKQRVIRKGRMYKAYMEADCTRPGYGAFVLFAEPDDESAIKRAFGLADWSIDCLYAEDRPPYTYPFKLFNVNPNGADRFIYDYKPKGERPKWDVYQLYIPDTPYVQLTTIYFFAKDVDSAKVLAHQKARSTLLNFEGLQSTPEGFVPRPYQLHKERGGLVVDYTPPADIEINPLWLQTV